MERGKKIEKTNGCIVARDVTSSQPVQFHRSYMRI